MTQLPAVSKVLMVTIRVDLGDGTPGITRFFERYASTAPTNAQLNTFCAAVGTAWNTNIAALADTGQLLKEVDAIDLSSTTGAVGSDTTTHPGTRGAGFIGASTCLVASYQIARRFRGGHARGYWPIGIQTDLNDRNTWKSTFTSAAKTGLDALFTAVAAAGWTGAGALDHVAVSYYSGFSVVTNPVTHRARNVPTLRGTPVVDAVATIRANAAVGSQRRRDAYH